MLIMAQLYRSPWQEGPDLADQATQPPADGARMGVWFFPLELPDDPHCPDYRRHVRLRRRRRPPLRPGGLEGDRHRPPR
ncbi:hypothetical protein SMJ63A_200037 [Stenotrophomonas geniculata]